MGRPSESYLCRLENLLVSLPEPLSLPTSLAVLDLHNNVLQGNVPLPPPSVTYVDCSNNNFSSIPPNIEHIQFAVLILRKNNFHGKIGCPKNHGPWPKLQIVDLASNNFGDILPNRCLNTWEAMKRNGNETDGHLSFEALSLSGLYYQDSITVTIKGLQLELLKILTIFTSIDFSDNHFVGPIPDVIGNFNALYVLNLSHNALAGRIPPFLGNLSQLESLDLSVNQLSGTIPQELVGLTFLSFLNVSYNQLVGNIPTGNQFLTFENISFRDKILMVLLPMLGLVYYTSNDWRIAAEENFEEDSTDADYEESEDDLEGRFCVFCTKLDITRKRAIHDLKLQKAIHVDENIT
ncbi:hypothetical protein GH714_018205 [Hevea brasiliensis]|uniref:Leucine-rich repeat-containing N-terminal plant-type domain-containing protein n=1 Tax=Hevea brasiliensis TaxID=3981 RepID=A0A6A6LYB5_HEVBR|nr:hypothetical protein GH714_018205 [Hevea brasiliensis]